MRARRWSEPGALLCAAAFVLSAAAVAFYLIAGYGAYLDADMASELALAQHLAREGTLISPTWLYSTEVRVFSTQLVFTPLMALFGHDWRLVRTLGCLILLALLSASSYACARWMGARRRYALLFAGLTLCPCSAVYAQMIVIGAYYVPHAIWTNLLAGLTARQIRRPSRANAGLLAVLAFAIGAQSIRYLLCAVFPVAAAGAWLYVFPGREKDELPRGRGGLGAAIAAGLVGVCGLIGFAVGGRLLKAHFYGGGGIGGQRLSAITDVSLIGQAEDALAWLLRIGGYSERRLLLSAGGVLSVCAAAMPFLAALLFARAQSRAKREEQHAQRFGVLCAVMAFVLTLVSFVLLEGLFANRYWLPVMTLGAPALALALSTEKNPALRRLAALFIACSTLGLSLLQIRDSMISPERDGGDYANAQSLIDSGMDLGYATFWNANIMTELTNGRVELVAVSIEENEDGVAYPQTGVWLESVENTGENRPQQPVFLLLGGGEGERLSQFLSLCGAQAQPLQKDQTLYAIESQSLFFEAQAQIKK